MTIWLALVAGGALGFVLARGDFCFHATWRRVTLAPRDATLARAYVILLLISTPVVQLLLATGFIDPFIAPLAWPAALIGGAVFGMGMVMAQTCVSGIFYKFGTGMVGIVVAFLGWFIGDVVTGQGPLKGLRESLTDEPVTVIGDGTTTSAVTLINSGAAFWVAVLVVGAGLVALIARTASRESWVIGVGVAIVMLIGWVLVRWHGGDYSFGTSGMPSTVWHWIRGRGDGIDWWIPLALISLVPGALVYAATAGKLWVRGESVRRFAELGAGGVVMGVGAAIAGGCNLGHAMVGVPLLSAGSVVSTIAIIVGVIATTKLVLVLPGRAQPSAQQSDEPSRRSAGS